ncbi:hypothetical protein GOP47_0010875 [Adiantum capillus-veneris]|uniref:NAB domain-containing protein n=1 Tax=Adiantum capillus-veneris TaxID=13818 RepID=A0A9D4UVR8_ADICA|nr:hypothetical protein GOP47_0010875 [Adiantum capillus-veneris]
MSSVRWPTGGANWQSQALSHSDKREMKGRGGSKSHSWWWDSHNTPKNSKWLEDNLNDMDAKVKAMLKLIEEDADSFAKRAEMYYKKRPELVSLVEEFYRAYRSLAERYDQLTGHIRQIPQEIQAQFGFSGDAPPGSPSSGGSVRKRAAGFSAFLGRAKDKGRKGGSDSSSSSSSDSDSDSKHSKPNRADEMLGLQQDNEQLRRDLDRGVAHHQAMESRLADLQEELKSLQQENVQLHRNAASAHSEIAALEAEIERLKKENRTLGEEASSALRTAERLQQELEIAQGEQHRISIKLKESAVTIQDLEAKIKELELRILQVNEELLSSTGLCERQKHELDALSEERDTLQQGVSIQASKILELEEEITRLRGVLLSAEGERDRTFELHETLEKELANVHIEFSSLKVERGQLSEELLLKVEHMQSIEQQLIEVQEAMEGLKREKAEVAGLLNKTESSLKELQNEFHGMQGRLNKEISVHINEKLVLQQEVEELRAALEVLHGERSRGVELQDLFAKQVADLELQLKQSQEAHVSCESERIDLVNKAETSLLALRSEFDSVQERLHGEISVQSQERQGLADQVEELNSVLEDLRGEQSRAAELQDTLDKRVMDLDLQLKQSNEALGLREREKGEVTGLLSKVENELLNLRVEFTSVQESLNGEISAQAQEKQMLQTRIEELEAALEALQGERGRSLELQDVLEKRLMDYEQQLQQVQAALDLAEREKAEVGELLSKSELSLSELQEKSNSMQVRLTDELSALSEEKQFLTAQLEELQATLAALHSEKSRGVELQDVFEKRMIELQQELSQAKQEASSLSEDLAEKVAVVCQLEETLKTRDEIVSRLELDLLANQEEGEALRTQVEDCSKEIQRLEDDVLRLRVLLGESEDLARSFEKKANDYEQDLELGRTEVTRLRDELEDKVAGIGRLEAEVQDRDIQLAALREAHSGLEVEFAGSLQHAQQLELDVKTIEETAALRMEELAKVKVDLDLESNRAQRAEEKCLLQEQLIFGLQEEKARLLDQIVELEMRIKAMQEELEGLLAKIEDLCEVKEACDLEILALKDELSKVKLLSEETSSQFSETICSLKIEISKLEIHLAKRTQELQLFEKEQAGWYIEKAAYIEEINQATKEKEELQNTIFMWRRRMENLETEHTTLKTTSREVETSLLFHQSEHDKVRYELSEKAERIQWLEEELKRLDLELQGSQEAAGQLSMKLQSVSQELMDRLLAEEKKVHSLHDDVGRLQQELLSAKDEKESLTNTCEEHAHLFKVKEESLESQILKFKCEIQDLNELCKELTKKLEEMSIDYEALRTEKQALEETLLATQQERDSASTKCDSLQVELAQEHECRATAEAAASKLQGQIAELLREIARLQTELEELKNDNKTLLAKLEAALEQEKTDAMEIDTLLTALHGSHEENGSSDIGERSWHFEAEHSPESSSNVGERSWHFKKTHSGEGKQSTLRHLKESMLNLLTDRTRIRQEAAAHAEHIKTLNFQIENTGQILEVSRGDYHTLVVKYETTISELQSLHLRIEQFERQVQILEEEKRSLHDQLLSSVRDSDQLSSELLREKKELYEKLVVEGDHVLKLQQELKQVREEAVESRRSIDDLQRQIEKLNLDIRDITKAKDDQEKSLREELQLKLEEKTALSQSLNEALESLSLEKAEVTRLQEEKTVREQRLSKLEEEITLLKATLSEKEQVFTSSLSLSEQKAMDLLVQLGTLTQEKEDFSVQLQAKVVLLNHRDEEIQRLLKQLEESKLKVEGLKELSASISQKYDTTLCDLENLRLQLSSLQEENGRLGLDALARTVSVAELTETVSSAEKQNADLTAELKKLQENELVLQEQVANLQLESEQLKQTVKSHVQKTQVLDEEIFNLREIHTKLKSDHECISTEKQRSLDAHSLTLSSLEKMEEELLLQQNKNETLKTELRSQSERIQELEATIANLEKEKQAFSVEIASTGLLMNDLQKRANDLQEEVNRLRQELLFSNDQLQEKSEKIGELSSMCSALQEEKTAISTELEMKIQAFGSLEASFCSLKDEHLSLVDKYEVLTEEAASGANLILKLQEEISQLRSEKEAQAQELLHRKADIQRLEEDLVLVQDSEKQSRKLLDVKVLEIIQLEEELDRLRSARLLFHDEHKQSTERLEIELKRLDLVIISLRDEKVSLSEQHALALVRCNDLESTCKSLQKQLADQLAERKRLEAQLSLIDELRKEALDDEEMVRIMQGRVASKQHEIDQVQSINEDLKEIMRKFDSEVESLKEKIITLQKENTSLNEEVSAKASLVQELDERFTSLKEKKVVFEGGHALAVGNVSLVQAEVDKLLEKISKLNELSIYTAENLRKMEDRICKLQVSNLNLGDEISGFAKKEKSYVIAVRFMRAEFFCLAQRIKAMKEEKVELARLAELAMEAEKKKNGDVLSGLQQELAFLREENKRQRTIIFDRAEEKREAIRQLCATLDYMQTKNRRLEGVINSVRDKIQRRIAASGTRRS